MRRGTTTPPPATGKFTVGLTTSSLAQGGKFKLKFRITTQPAKPRGTARIKVTGPGAVTPSQQTIQLGANGAGTAEATVSQPGTYNAIATVTVGGVTKTATDKEKVTARPSKPGAETVTLTPFIEWTAVERADGKGCPAGRVTLPPKTVTLGPPTIKNNVITPGEKAELTWTKRVCIADRVRAGLNGRYLSGPQRPARLPGRRDLLQLDTATGRCRRRVPPEQEREPGGRLPVQVHGRAPKQQGPGPGLDKDEPLSGHQRVVPAREEDGGYSVSVPRLPGCTSQGETREEALAMIREAIALYLESLEAHGDLIPAPIEIERVTVSA